MSYLKKGKKQSMKVMFSGLVKNKSIDSNGNQRITLNSDKILELMFSRCSEEQLRNYFDRGYDLMIKEKGYEESNREITWESTFLPRIKK